MSQYEPEPPVPDRAVGAQFEAGTADTGETAFSWRTVARTYECDPLGHVNNAVYLAYLLQATVEAWGHLSPQGWRLRRLAMDYLAPARTGDSVEVMAWPDGLDAASGLLRVGYVVRGMPAATLLVRARAAWQAPDGTQAQSVPWPSIQPPMDHGQVRPQRTLTNDVGGRAFRWRHVVRRYEADASGHASPIAILNWAEEAKFFASAQVGWSIQRAAEAGLVVVQIRHDSQFLEPLAVGDEVLVLSRVSELRRVRGTWEHRFYRDGRLVALNYSAGAFLTLDGRPRPAPQAMVDALLAGQGPPVVSVVAKSGTGKTTFMERLIPALKAHGLRVGVVKHHGHPTSFDVPGKDTYRHAQAGADVVVGASAVQVAIFRQEDGSADLDEIIARHCGGLDIVLTEGYKRGSYPKIEVHRSGRSHELLCRPEELLALVSDASWSLDVPQFGLEDAEGVADFLVRWCSGGRWR